MCDTFFFFFLSWSFLYWCNGTGTWCWPPVPLAFCGSSGGLLWCSPPAPAHKRRLELKLLLGSCSTDACSHPLLLQMQKEGLLWISQECKGRIWPWYFPLWGALCSFLRVDDGSPLPFVFLNGILSPLPLWFSDGFRMLCSCTHLLVDSSLLSGMAVQSVSTRDCFRTML